MFSIIAGSEFSRKAAYVVFIVCVVEPMRFVAVLSSDVVHHRPRDATPEFHDDVLTGWIQAIEWTSANEHH